MPDVGKVDAFDTTVSSNPCPAVAPSILTPPVFVIL
jgi:hypothetical protein